MHSTAATSKAKPTKRLKPQFVKSRGGASQKKQALSSGPKLVRTTFSTSREMDFFSARELVTQTGHPVEEWPLVFLKETIDNALDACEEADIGPDIQITADVGGISVADNGPGLPEATLKAQLNFSIRASNREAYVSPCRGAQGNALKTLLPMAWVIDPTGGRLIVTAHGKQHSITCGADPISQRAVVRDECMDQPTKGTTIRIQWTPKQTAMSGDVWPFNGNGPLMPAAGFEDLFRSMVVGFALFNPHASFSLNWFGNRSTWPATNTAWEKWKPYKPTSPHWYELRHLERLIGAYITHDRDAGSDRLVSEFIAEFDGLTGSQKRSKVLDQTNLCRVKLSELARDTGFDSKRIQNLLVAMQEHTRPVNPQRLGMIGEDHFRSRLLEMGVQPDSFRYTRKFSKNVKLLDSRTDEKASFIEPPWILESAFGWKGEASKDHRNIFAGANWSAAIKNPFRSFGQTGEGLEAALSDMKAGASEPIVFALHLAHPRVEYVDRGKSALIVKGGAH